MSTRSGNVHLLVWVFIVVFLASMVRAALGQEPKYGPEDEPLLECDWTIKVQDEFRVGEGPNYTAYVLMLEAAKLGGTDPGGRYYGGATLHAEFERTIEGVSGGGRMQFPASDEKVAFTLGPSDSGGSAGHSRGGITVAPLVTEDFSAKGGFNFVTRGNWHHWASKPALFRPSLPPMLQLGYEVKVFGARVKVTVYNLYDWSTERPITGEFWGTVVGDPVQ